jgi:hypothetical protein
VASPCDEHRVREATQHSALSTHHSFRRHGRKLTGHVPKDTDAVMKNVAPDQIVEIDPTIDEVKKVLSAEC